MKKIFFGIVLLHLLFQSYKETRPTRLIYGLNIIYYDFYKIPVESLNFNEEIPLPADLDKFFNNNLWNPKIENFKELDSLFWAEASLFNLTPEKIKYMGFKEVIKVIVDIIAYKMNYFNVDLDTNFTKKYGSNLPIETYFKLGLGDCDKYRDLTIALFSLVKPLNPNLKNIYLSTERLGGKILPHAWVSIIILQKNRIILSHIDPTFYDNNNPLEATDFHLHLRNDVFKADFYRGLSGEENLIYAYQILEGKVSTINENTELEEILDNMSYLLLLISYYNLDYSVLKIPYLIKIYEEKGFTKTLDNLLYRAYKIYLNAKDISKAEYYKQRLIKEFPNSYWIKKL
jgi:hypothetical protein